MDRHDLSFRDHALAIISETLSPFAESEHGLVAVNSSRSFEETIEALKGVLGNLGLRILFVLDFPLKFLASEAGQYQVHISYYDVKFLAKRHNVQGLD